MEITQACNEHTPLLENSIVTNGHLPLVGSHATFNQQAPLYGNEVTYGQSPPSGQGTVSNLSTIQASGLSPRNFDFEPDEVSLEEVAQAMYTAWCRLEQPIKEITLNFFSTKELCAMHLAWKNVTRGRHCYAENYKIAEALAAAIARDRYPPYPDDLINDMWGLSFYAEKNLIAANLLKEWERITEGVGFPRWYYESFVEDSEVQPLNALESILERIEMYEKIYDFIFSDRFQICLHSLLFIWPISILVVGFKYLECPMSSYLSCLFMILGVVGCIASLIRLALIHVASQARDQSQWAWKWLGFRTVEFTFLILFIIQAFHVFQTDPTTEPDPHHCIVSFYYSALKINCVSIALISAYACVYSINFLLYLFFDYPDRL